MEQLPADVLIGILQRVDDLEDLFACRVTCKRLAEVALHPDVWSHRKIHGMEEDEPWERAALKLAPCLYKIEIVYPPYPGPHDLPYETTSCAAEVLCLEVTEGAKESDIDRAAQTIRSQGALGRLRHLDIRFEYGIEVANEVELVKAAISTANLVKLELSRLPTSAAVCDALCSNTTIQMPALKLFSCVLAPFSENFCHFMLEKHASTLEEISLGCYQFPSIEETEATVTLLAGMPKLRKLVCSSLYGMEALAASESLSDLTIMIEDEWADGIPGLEELFRRAVHLREITISHQNDISESDALGLDLVLALASSGKSPVESLCIMNGPMNPSVDSLPQLASLLHALPLLPNLKHLSLSQVPDELLLAITPETAPALRRFSVYSSMVALMSVCAHTWVHKKVTKTLLSRNPALHMVIIFPPCRRGGCDTCSQGCHKKLMRMEPWSCYVGLYSHPKGDCPSRDVHTSPHFWVKV